MLALGENNQKTTDGVLGLSDILSKRDIGTFNLDFIDDCGQLFIFPVLSQ